MKRKYAVVWIKKTPFGKMVDISKFIANSYTEAISIGYLKVKNDKFGKCIEVVTIDLEKYAKQAWENKFAELFKETCGN